MQLDISQDLQNSVVKYAKRKNKSLCQSYYELITMGLNRSEEIQQKEEKAASMQIPIPLYARGTIRSIKL